MAILNDLKSLEVGRTAPLFAKKGVGRLGDIANRMAAAIGDEQLRDFCGWYRRHHSSAPVCLSVFVTCLCGYFHTFSRVAEAIAVRCKEVGLIRIENKVVTFN